MANSKCSIPGFRVSCFKEDRDRTVFIRVHSRFKPMNQISELYTKWYGLVPILAGIYAILLGGGILPIKFGNPEYSGKWQKRYGGIVKYLGLMAILAGMSALLLAYYS
jgi:hypothetical protein